MTTKEKFDAAVNVIRGLPKRGSYQPSNELMLRFYSYFKQATEGKCNIPKPGFWDLINRAKWDAWNKLGNMSSEDAMKAYVEELHKIVETMSYTDNVAAFFDTMDDNSDIPISKNDLFLVAGDVFKKSNSSPSTPTGTRESSHSEHLQTCNGYLDSEDEFVDTEELSQEGIKQHEDNIPIKHNSYNYSTTNGHLPQSVSDQSSVGSTSLLETNNRVLEELRRTVVCLEKDVSILKNKLQTLDKEQKALINSVLLRRPSWWPIKSVSPAVLVLIFLWPAVANRLTNMIRKKK